jgi:hypothetical protein
LQQINILTIHFFFLKSLQSYDGGIAGYCDEESHAGYTYCGLAALALLQKAHYLDLNSLLVIKMKKIKIKIIFISSSINFSFGLYKDKIVRQEDSKVDVINYMIVVIVFGVGLLFKFYLN